MRIEGPGRLRGERVVLRDLAAGDVDPFVEAFVADAPLAADLGHDAAPTPDEVRGLLAEEGERRERGERLRLAMAEPRSDAFLGDVVLHSFDWRHRRADLGVFLLAPARGRGVATEALRLLTRWAFGALGLWRIGVMTLPDNARMQQLALRAGFTREGVLRGFTFERGRHMDDVVFSLLAPEAA